MARALLWLVAGARNHREFTWKINVISRKLSIYLADLLLREQFTVELTSMVQEPNKVAADIEFVAPKALTRRTPPRFRRADDACRIAGAARRDSPDLTAPRRLSIK
jgi:hypothetical protein